MARREETEWAWRDVRWVAAYGLALMLFAINVVFGWLLVALTVALGARLLAGWLRRRRRERAHDAPFWADHIQPPPRR